MRHNGVFMLASLHYEVSISDEKPLHMRHEVPVFRRSGSGWFQSQTRSRSTCDEKEPRGQKLTRFVSISDEKPLHMRPPFPRAKEVVELCFNLRREAAPHATICARRAAFSFQRFQSQTRSRSTCDVELSTLWRMAHTVSISDEKPLHMRES